MKTIGLIGFFVLINFNTQAQAGPQFNNMQNHNSQVTNQMMSASFPNPCSSGRCGPVVRPRCTTGYCGGSVGSVTNNMNQYNQQNNQMNTWNSLMKHYESNQYNQQNNQMGK